MQSLPKYAISAGSYTTEWENSHIIDGDVAAKIRKLKSQPGKDIALFAGAGVFQTFDALGLIDEYRIVVNPILLGDGTRLFKSGSHRAELTLLRVKQFKSGAVMLSYSPASKA
ncbi:MAG: dihydrofolate reductase family protein [Gammaproteobacteria bacterium]